MTLLPLKSKSLCLASRGLFVHLFCFFFFFCNYIYKLVVVFNEKVASVCLNSACGDLQRARIAFLSVFCFLKVRSTFLDGVCGVIPSGLILVGFSFFSRILDFHFKPSKISQ